MCRDNVSPAISRKALMESPARFDYERLSHPPSTFRHEKLKFEQRLPAARRFILEHGLNEIFGGRHADIGIIVQGGLHNALVRACSSSRWPMPSAPPRFPLLVLNVTYPLVPEQIADFCRGKRAVLVVEEGQPEFIEQEIATALRRMEIDTALHGKDLLPMAGEYNVEVIAEGLVKFLARHAPTAVPLDEAEAWLAANAARRAAVTQQLGAAAAAAPAAVLRRLPGAAGVLGDQAGAGQCRPGALRGRHRLPFLRHFRALRFRPHHPRLRHEPGQPRRRFAHARASRHGGDGRRRLLAQRPADRRRVGLFNQDDAVLLIMKNGYTSATGTQEIISTPDEEIKAAAETGTRAWSIAIAASRTRSRASASAGCARCRATRSRPCAARWRRPSPPTTPGSR
jgi:indolepyruvate ferredoxin oxidoreductase alpha subunit